MSCINEWLSNEQKEEKKDKQIIIIINSDYFHLFSDYSKDKIYLLKAGI